jgi:hypothetical protein
MIVTFAMSRWDSHENGLAPGRLGSSFAARGRTKLGL